jgi:pilus assembly protein Flp/PilA
MGCLTMLLSRVVDNGARGAAMSRLIKDNSGVTAIEYSLIAALIVVVAIAIIGSVGTNLSNTFSTVAANL